MTDKCYFDDHGYRCHRWGSISPGTRGEGPWYCSEHYFKVFGSKSNAPKAEKEIGARHMKEIMSKIKSAKLAN